jgi:hypothetical protein
MAKEMVCSAGDKKEGTVQRLRAAAAGQPTHGSVATRGQMGRGHVRALSGNKPRLR